jgi:hypothetical protein
LVVLVAAAVAGCGSSAPGSSPAWSYQCAYGTGPGCGAPEPITDRLYGPLWSDPTDASVSGRFFCGGALTATETTNRVAVTFYPQIVRPGAEACAVLPVTVWLTNPIGVRTVVDGVSGEPLTVARFVGSASAAASPTAG